MPLSILLNMIVKNEAHVIEKTLTTLCDKIKFDYWVISDTGSTDSTREIITSFFEKRAIKGELFNDEWKDFGHNRTVALQHAYNKSDLLFVFDADDSLVGTIIMPDQFSDAYHFHFGSATDISYWRICMVNNRKKWKYVGVLHEYIECLEKPVNNVFVQGDYYVHHGVDGGRSADPLKYSKDAAILEKGFRDLAASDPLRNRYAFYCGNCHKDAKDPDRAIVWYKIAIGLPGGWAQEKYKACMLAHDMYKKKNKQEEALFYALESHKYDAERVEGIYRLVEHYCSKEMNTVALTFYKLIQDWYENTYIKGGSALVDKLFADVMDYDFFLPYFMVIVSERLNLPDIGVKMYDFVFGKKKIGPAWYMNNFLINFQCFIKHFGRNKKSIIEKAKAYLVVLEDNNIEIPDVFYQSLFALNKMC
jgi:glycosyltransferase involved in cell wall biosynthesis